MKICNKAEKRCHGCPHKDFHEEDIYCNGMCPESWGDNAKCIEVEQSETKDEPTSIGNVHQSPEMLNK